MSLTSRKKQKIQKLGCDLLQSSEVSIRDLARFIGNLVAVEPAFAYAPLYYKRLEIFRNDALHLYKGNYDAKIVLSKICKGDIIWWCRNIDFVQRNIIVPSPSLELRSDASRSGWGVATGTQTTGGFWSSAELKII